MKTPKIRVLTVIISALPSNYYGGAEKAALELSKALADRKEFEITVARTSDIDKIDTEDSLTVQFYSVHKPAFLPKRISNIFINPKSLIARITKRNFDLVHIHNIHPAIALAHVVRKCKLENIPYIISAHGIVEAAINSEKFEKSFATKLLSKYLLDMPTTYALKNADAILALSKKELPIYNKYFVSKGKISVTYNGVDPTIGAKPNKVKGSKLPFGKNETVVLFASRVQESKGADLLIQAASNLQNAKIAIVGQPSSPEYYEHIKTLAKELGVEKNITFIGWVSNETLRDYYQRCDIFVLPTRADTLPLSILDAMAYGKPVVSTTVGGIPELITKENGILVTPNNPDMLAKALQTLIDNKQMRLRMGKNSALIVSKKFSWHQVAEHVAKVYKNVYTQII
jgi:alpha-maltose-1-phosphate synthase